jgi:two-component system response regulator FixJ
MQNPLAIDLVTDDPATPDLFAPLLNAFGVSLKAHSSLEALGHCIARARCVILDLKAQAAGIELTDEILAWLRTHPTIVTSANGGIESAVRCMRAGATFYLEQPVDNDQLAAALQACAAWRKPAVMPCQIGARERLLRLSQREREVLDFVIRGAPTKAAARALGISPRTVECHRARLKTKLGAPNLATLIQMVGAAAA